ncbi:hypothetical protein MRX96_040661 [Rhipicephalus microplus]
MENFAPLLVLQVVRTMGCGVSKVHAAADPSSQQPKRGFAAQVRWSQDGSKRSTPTAVAERLVDAQVQVENKYEQRDRDTQTDIHYNMTRGNYDEDDLDFDEDDLSSFGDDYTDEGVVENGASPGGSQEGIRFADPRLVATTDGNLMNRGGTPVTVNAKAFKQQMLMMDAEQSILMLSKRIHLDIDMTPRSVATSDVGVQAGSGRSNRSVKLGF